MWDRIRNSVYLAFGAAIFLGGGAKIAFFDTRFSHNPTHEDSLTGHVVPYSVRGVGTVYLTTGEYEPVRILIGVGGGLAGLMIVAVGIDAYYGYRKKRTKDAASGVTRL
jgi:hypothetical protein